VLAGGRVDKTDISQVEGVDRRAEGAVSEDGCH